MQNLVSKTFPWMSAPHLTFMPSLQDASVTLYGFPPERHHAVVAATLRIAESGHKAERRVQTSIRHHVLAVIIYAYLTERLLERAQIIADEQFVQQAGNVIRMSGNHFLQRSTLRRQCGWREPVPVRIHPGQPPSAHSKQSDPSNIR